MKPKHKRPPKVPANFVFIGIGGAFTPVKNEAYYCAFRSEWYPNSGFKSDDPKYYSPQYVFYVKKNGPTHKLNRPISKKKFKYTAVRGLKLLGKWHLWNVLENERNFGSFDNRKDARKVAKALNQMEE
jgi:hypothetical protein